MPNSAWKEAVSILLVLPGLAFLKLCDLVRTFLWLVGESKDGGDR